MKCWDENSLRSIAALICTSAKCARNLGTRARRITSRRSAAPGIFLRWQGLRVKRNQMRSLFLKIFLSFWIAQALFLVLAILVTVAMRPAREISTVEASQSRFLSEAVAAYQAGGAEKVRDYLHNLGET